MFFKLSLAQWSLHRAYFGEVSKLPKHDFFNLISSDPQKALQGKLDPLYFAKHAQGMFRIDAIEYVNTFYFDKAEDQAYISEMKTIAEGEGVESVLIMCDAEGMLGDPDSDKRSKAVENHYKWLQMAKYLGCHAIRVNAVSEGGYDEQMKLASDGLRQLTEYAADMEMNILVENHGGFSSNARWLADTIRIVDHPNCGTLPDFGNFTISDTESYDIYRGVEELMPLAKGVSAKSLAFDDRGNESDMDYARLMKIVKNTGYTGYVGIEYEGDDLPEEEGIKKTKKLLARTAKELE
ncbi:MAG: sugar phosphate isomerase/epimerase [Balneolaceae bacterium]|nr:MAG: sugar phosphate isomerase/epimerase [Balneolaceae bacterium]